MEGTCGSQSRCFTTSCEPCAWRYSLGISRRILAHDPRRLFAFTIQPNLTGIGEFSGWRTAVRNIIDYRRRECRWWRDLGVWGWLGADGSVRGVVSLGSVTDSEFCDAPGRRWWLTTRAIEAGEVRTQVYFAMKPDIIAQPASTGRYQSVRLAIEPQPTHWSGNRSQTVTRVSIEEPLPVLL